MTNQVSVVIPAFNEGEIIGQTLGELKQLLVIHGIDAEVIVVDDGSTDTTTEAALAAQVRVLRHRRNRGYGAALKTGISAATHNVVAIADADGTYPFEYLPQMLEALDNEDMVVGARTGEKVHIPPLRRPAKWLLNRLANYVSGHRIVDLNSGLRVFHRDTVLQYFPILPDQFSWTTTITLAMLCDGYSVKYVPIDYRSRVGQSKIVPWDAGTFTVLVLRTAILFRPLKVFLPLVLACASYGVIKTIIDLGIVGDRNISASAILMLMSALIVLLMGMIADAMVTRLGRFNPTRLASARVRESVELTSELLKMESSAERKPG